MTTIDPHAPRLSGTAADLLHDLASEYERSLVERAVGSRGTRTLEASDILNAYYSEYSTAQRIARRERIRVLISVFSLLGTAATFATIYVLVKHAAAALDSIAISAALGVSVAAAAFSLGLLVSDFRERRMARTSSLLRESDKLLLEWHKFESALRRRTKAPDQLLGDVIDRAVLAGHLDDRDKQTIVAALSARNRILHGGALQKGETLRATTNLRNVLNKLSP